MVSVVVRHWSTTPEAPGSIPGKDTKMFKWVLYFFSPVLILLILWILSSFKGLFIWRRVTWLAELLGKGEIPAAILKYCFAGSLFIWDRRVTYLAEISAKRAGRLGELTIVPCKHFFPGLITRHAEIRFRWKRVCFTLIKENGGS